MCNPLRDGDMFKFLINILGEMSPSFQEIYVNSGNSVEKWTVIMYNVMVKATPLASLIPNSMALLWKHYTRGEEKDDFHLLYPYW